MTLQDIPYPQRLIVELLHYAVWSCEKTQNMKSSEIKAAMAVFFTEAQIAEAQAYLEGMPMKSAELVITDLPPGHNTSREEQTEMIRSNVMDVWREIEDQDPESFIKGWIKS